MKEKWFFPRSRLISARPYLDIPSNLKRFSCNPRSCRMLPYQEILGLMPNAGYEALIANMHVLRQHYNKLRINFTSTIHIAFIYQWLTLIVIYNFPRYMAAYPSSACRSRLTINMGRGSIFLAFSSILRCFLNIYSLAVFHLLSFYCSFQHGFIPCGIGPSK